MWIFECFLSLPPLKKHCSIVPVTLWEKKKGGGACSCTIKHIKQLKNYILLSEGQHILYEGSFLLFRVRTCYKRASFPKAEIWALLTLIAFEMPGLTGISGSVLPCGHHLKLPMEKSQLRVSSWRKQFSCITSSMSSACGSGSQERQNQQMQVRYRGSLQFRGSRSAV